VRIKDKKKEFHWEGNISTGRQPEPGKQHTEGRKLGKKGFGDATIGAARDKNCVEKKKKLKNALRRNHT